MNSWIKNFHSLYFLEGKYEVANKLKVEHLPPSLFRYRSTSDIPRIIEQLKNSTPAIYLTNPVEFNDPYDTRIPVSFENTYLFKESMGKQAIPMIRNYLLQYLDPKYFSNTIKPKIRIYKKKFTDAANIEDWDKWVIRYVNLMIQLLSPIQPRITTKDQAISVFQEYIDELRKSFSDMFKKNCGIACFTEQPDSLTMWAHYAENHRGICVEYTKEELLKLSSSGSDVLFPVYYSDEMQDFTEEFLEAGVQYLPDLIESANSNDYHPYGNKLIEFGWENKYIQSFGSQKSTAWEAENEWRLIYPLPDTENKEKRLLPVQISAIYLGTEISDEDAKMLKETVDTYAPTISLYKMRIRPDRFELEYYPI